MKRASLFIVLALLASPVLATYTAQSVIFRRPGPAGLSWSS